MSCLLAVVLAVAGLPPINPAQARPDQVIPGLDGPGFSIAASDTGGYLAAGCERGTIHYWTKDVSLGVRSGAFAPSVLKAHEGPVLALACHGPTLVSAGADQK